MTQNKQKILYIVTQAEWGGAQKYVFDLSTNLVDEFDVTVAVGAAGSSRELLDKLMSAKIKNFTFKHLKRDINLWHDILAIFEIAKFLRQNHFDIIHLNSTKAGVLGAIAALLNRFLAPLGMTKTKIIYTVHGWAYLEPLPFYKRWLYLMMEKIAARLRDHTIVLSEKEKQIALQYGTAKPNAIAVIANGLDLANLNFLTREAARKKLNLDQNQTIVGTIANLYKTKGLEYLLEAISNTLLDGIASLLRSSQYRTTLNDIASPPQEGEAIHNIKELHLIIIGEGPERKNLESKIKQNKLEDAVVLCGSIAQACKYLPAFDIFVLPSIKEGFPYTLLEAMAAGLPIVTTDVGAISEILENQKTGLIVPPADSLALREAVDSLIKNPEQAKQLGFNAKEVVKKFDLGVMIEKTKIAYTCLN